MDIVEFLNINYSIRFEKHEHMRDAGSSSYTVYAKSNKYFLRVVNPVHMNEAINGADVQYFLQNLNFPVPHIIIAKNNLPYVSADDGLFILYEFINGGDCDPENDVEAIGELVGKLHGVMKKYPGKLTKRDKHFFIGRYVDIINSRQYTRTDEFSAYSDALWEKIKDLPRGYCHGDMYDGNIRKTSDGKLYIHDFDTSCEGFPMYDPTLICDMTEYFKYDVINLHRSNNMLSRFIPEYNRHRELCQEEIEAFHALIAIQHFTTQATVMEIFGNDCLNDTELDSQLDWLYRWREQCCREGISI